jgi:hypothetical protein
MRQRLRTERRSGGGDRLNFNHRHARDERQRRWPRPRRVPVAVDPAAPRTIATQPRRLRWRGDQTGICRDDGGTPAAAGQTTAAPARPGLGYLLPGWSMARRAACGK